jgi:mRNA interferase RelE/StbE
VNAGLWTLSFSKRATKDLRRLNTVDANRVVAFLEDKIAANPRRFGKALSGPLAKLWRYRVGDYRVIARIEDDRLVVLVVAIGHRREVYR